VVIAVVAFVGVPFGGGGGDAGDGGDGGPGTGTPDFGDADMPPGVNVSGVYDDDALVEAHREALMASGFSYRFTHRMTERVDNGTPEMAINVTGSVRSTANLSSVRQLTDRTAPADERIVSWVNESDSAKRIQANGTSYESYVASPTWRVTLHYVVLNQLSLAEWNLSEVRETDGGTRFVLVANDRLRVSDGTGTDDVDDYAARMVVDAEGRIRRFEVNVTTTAIVGDEGNRRVVSSTRHVVYELTAVGNVSVPPPDWLNRTRGSLVPGSRPSQSSDPGVSDHPRLPIRRAEP